MLRPHLIIALSAVPGCASRAIETTSPTSGLPEGPWFSEAARIETLVDGQPEGGEAIALLDVDGDDLLDAVIVNGTTSYYVAIATFDGDQLSYDVSPVEVTIDGAPTTTKAIATHDLDGDGRLDLYLGGVGSGSPILERLTRWQRTWSDPPTEDQISLAPADRPAPAHRTQIGDGTGRFAYAPLGIDGDGTTRAALFSDFDGDGADDCYLSNAPYYGAFWSGSAVPNQLYPGIPGGGFGPDILSGVVTNRPEGSLFFEERCAETCERQARADFKGTVVRDLDGDGLPDLVSGAYADIWDGRTFFPIATTFPRSAEWDLDGNGISDGGYQGNWLRGLLLLHNTSTPGSIAFDEVSNAALAGVLGTSDQMHVYVALPADIDNDADFDLLVSGPRDFTAQGSIEHHTPVLRVLRNDSTPGVVSFTDVTELAGVAFVNEEATMPEPYPLVAPDVLADGVVEGTQDLMAAPRLSAGAALDIDNDADLDWVMVDRQFVGTVSEFENLRDLLFGGTVEPEGVLHTWVFLNDGEGRFQYVDPAIHGLLGTARDLSYGDLNRDGRLDLVLVNGSGGGQEVADDNRVLLNQIHNANHWLRLRVATPDDPLGLGTVVTVRDAGNGRVLGHQELRTDFGYRSRRPAELHFGLGLVDEITITLRLRDGEQRVVEDVPVDGGVRLTYDGSAITWDPIAP